MNLKILLSLSFFLSHSAQVAARGVNFRQHPQLLELPEARQLVAAVQSSRLQARGEVAPIELHRRASFDYLHENDDHPDSVFAVTLDVQSQLPILVLEDIDHGLGELICSDSQMKISFSSPGRGTELKRAVEPIDEFVLVTSHRGCDTEGERSAHRVTKVKFDDNEQVAFIDRVGTTWQDAFHSTGVSFSRRHRSTIQKRAHNLALRQEEQQEPTSTDTMDETTSTATLTFPSPTTTAGVESDATTSLNKHFIDLTMFPPPIPGADMFIPQGVTVSCKNCSFQGDIELTMGSFNLTGSDVTDIKAFFESGSVEVLANNLFAQIELGLDLDLSQPLASLNMSLPGIPLIPFAIPGVLVFGPIIEPQFTMSLDLKGEIGFSYGFNLSVPNDARIEVNMAELANSSMTGFQETTIHALPFESTAALTSLIFSVAFNPQILLGIEAGSGYLSGGIGASLNLPKLTLNATQLSDVDEKCEPVSDGGDEGDDSITSALDNVFGSLTNLVPSVELDMGVLADFEVDLPAVFNTRLAIENVLASTSYPLPTACLQFDSEKQSYSPPIVTPVSKSGDASSGGVSKENENKESRSTRIEAEGAMSVMLGMVILIAVMGLLSI